MGLCFFHINITFVSSESKGIFTMFAFVFSLFHLLTEPSPEFKFLYEIRHGTDGIKEKYEDMNKKERINSSISTIQNPFVRYREATTTDCCWTPDQVLVDRAGWLVDGPSDLQGKEVRN